MGSCRASPRKGRGSRGSAGRSTWYRRKAKARQEAALAATFTRAEAFTRQLQTELAGATR